MRWWLGKGSGRGWHGISIGMAFGGVYGNAFRHKTEGEAPAAFEAVLHIRKDKDKRESD